MFKKIRKERMIPLLLQTIKKIEFGSEQNNLVKRMGISFPLEETLERFNDTTNIKTSKSAS